MSRFAERRPAWAIDDTDGRLISAAYFRPLEDLTPKHLRGIKTAIFKTREDARAALKRVRGVIPDARLVKVTISYETVL